MAFTPKDWKQFPDTSTPWNAASAEDLEVRVTNYAESYAAITQAAERLAINTKTQHGAVGNGTTDDRAAIQAALDAAAASTRGGAVFLPPGLYLIGSPGLVWPQTTKTVRLVGSGRGGQGGGNTFASTMLIRNGSYPLMNIISGSSAISSLQIENMTLNGNGVSSTTLVDIDWLSNSSFREVRFWGNHLTPGRGIHGRGLWNVHFTDCFTTTCGSSTTIPAWDITDSAIAGSGATNTVCVVNCEWEGDKGTDVIIGGTSGVASGVQISNCKFERSTGHVIRFENCHSCGVYNSMMYLQDHANQHVVFNEPSLNGSNCLMGNNMLNGGSTQPAQITMTGSGQMAVVIGNTFYANPTTGTPITIGANYKGVIIQGNTIVDWDGSQQLVTDNRTTKQGTVQQTIGRTNYFDGLGIKSKAGSITDADFLATPPNSGAAVLAWNDTANTLMVRKPNGTYRTIATT